MAQGRACGLRPVDDRPYAERGLAGVHQPRHRFERGLWDGIVRLQVVRSQVVRFKVVQLQEECNYGQAVSIVEVKVHGLILERKTQQNVVILREEGGERILPIWI